LKLPQRSGVKGPRLNALHTQCAQSGPHLTRGAGGEGDGKDVPWLLAPALACVSDPMSDRPGLAGARPGQHTDGAVERRRHDPLFGIEGVEHFVRSHTSKVAEPTDTAWREISGEYRHR
jgi:hypothetical protein